MDTKNRNQYHIPEMPQRPEIPQSEVDRRFAEIMRDVDSSYGSAELNPNPSEQQYSAMGSAALDTPSIQMTPPDNSPENIHHKLPIARFGAEIAYLRDIELYRRNGADSKNNFDLTA